MNIYVLFNIYISIRFSTPICEYSFKKFRINLSSLKNHVRNIEVKLVQKIGDFHTFYEIGLENKKILEKF